MIQLLFKLVKYRALDNLKRPFIFAYSAHVTQDILQKTKTAGFDLCVDSPISKAMCENLIDKYADKFIEN